MSEEKSSQRLINTQSLPNFHSLKIRSKAQNYYVDHVN